MTRKQANEIMNYFNGQSVMRPECEVISTRNGLEGIRGHMTSLIQEIDTDLDDIRPPQVRALVEIRLLCRETDPASCDWPVVKERIFELLKPIKALCAGEFEVVLSATALQRATFRIQADDLAAAEAKAQEMIDSGDVDFDWALRTSGEDIEIDRVFIV